MQLVPRHDTAVQGKFCDAVRTLADAARLPASSLATSVCAATARASASNEDANHICRQIWCPAACAMSLRAAMAVASAKTAVTAAVRSASRPTVMNGLPSRQMVCCCAHQYSRALITQARGPCHAPSPVLAVPGIPRVVGTKDFMAPRVHQICGKQTSQATEHAITVQAAV